MEIKKEGTKIIDQLNYHTSKAEFELLVGGSSNQKR